MKAIKPSDREQDQLPKADMGHGQLDPMVMRDLAYEPSFHDSSN